ncbi:hypothetical protein B0H14DRAFT_2562334 [Mycena olivaceomarginata]|nr:hypothetical protein B0H14DRAFT_2562334 [Mycena olivaceomarginata]
MRRKMEKVVPEMVAIRVMLVDMITSLSPEVVKEWTEMAEKEDMHITELIAMGLQLKQHKLIVMGLQLKQHSECWAPHKFLPGLANIRAHEDKVSMHAAEAQPMPGVMVSSIKLWLLSDVVRAPAADTAKVAVKDTVFLHKHQLRACTN